MLLQQNWRHQEAPSKGSGKPIGALYCVETAFQPFGPKATLAKSAFGGYCARQCAQFVVLFFSAPLRLCARQRFLGFGLKKNPCIAQRRRGAEKTTYCSGFAGQNQKQCRSGCEHSELPDERCDKVMHLPSQRTWKSEFSPDRSNLSMSFTGGGGFRSILSWNV